MVAIWPAKRLAREGGAGGADRLIRPHPAEEDLRHAELDLDLGEVVERGQHGLVVDPGADVDPADADDAGERRPHGAIGELLSAPHRAALGADDRPPRSSSTVAWATVLLVRSLRARSSASSASRSVARASATAACSIWSSRRTRTAPASTRSPGRERDLGDPARAQRDDVDRLARERRADRLDPLADRAGVGRGDLDRDGAGAPPHRGRRLAVDPLLMIGTAPPTTASSRAAPIASWVPNRTGSLPAGVVAGEAGDHLGQKGAGRRFACSMPP